MENVVAGQGEYVPQTKSGMPTWGKILVGAAIAAGAVAVIAFCPAAANSIGASVSHAATAAGSWLASAAESVGSWINSQASNLASLIQHNVGASVGIAAGTGAAAMAVEDSFAKRVEMDRMQARMMSAMNYQAAGAGRA